MFDLEQIMNLTAADAIILNDLKGIAEEAKSHSKLIHKAYHCFGIAQKKIEVWHDPERNNFEYLTHDGVWQARYLHQTYDVGVDVNSIFELYKAEYLVKKRFSTSSEDKEKERIAGYFRSFIRNIKIEKE